MFTLILQKKKLMFREVVSSHRVVIWGCKTDLISKAMPCPWYHTGPGEQLGPKPR